MMGVMLMTGLAYFGAIVAIAWLSSSMPASSEPASTDEATKALFSLDTRANRARQTTPAAKQRGLAVIMLAFIQGVAVMATVTALLALFLAHGAHGAGDGLWALIPALVGVGTGLLLARRNGYGANRGVVTVGASFAGGLVMLSLTVALLAVFIPGVGSAGLPDGPFVLLGVLIGLSPLLIGRSGAEALRAMAATDDPATADKIRGAQIIRASLLQWLGVGATVVAILLILTS